MNILRLIYFLKLIKDFGKRTHGHLHVSVPGCATWHADVIMRSAGGLDPLTLAVGRVDVRVDWSTLTSQRSMGSGGQWVLLVSHTMSLTDGTHVSGR
jgi:hypothetical protein